MEIIDTIYYCSCIEGPSVRKKARRHDFDFIHEAYTHVRSESSEILTSDPVSRSNLMGCRYIKVRDVKPARLTEPHSYHFRETLA